MAWHSIYISCIFHYVFGAMRKRRIDNEEVVGSGLTLMLSTLGFFGIYKFLCAWVNAWSTGRVRESFLYLYFILPDIFLVLIVFVFFCLSLF